MMVIVPSKPEYIPNWLMTDKTWDVSPLSERFLHVLRAQQLMGIKEITANWSPQIKLYLKSVGLFSPAPWCAAFINWALQEAGVPRKMLAKYPASTWWMIEWAKKMHLDRAEPARGRVFVWYNYTGGHTGAITKVHEGKIYTIEGNTNHQGAREGHGVFDRVRTVGSIKSNRRWLYIDIEALTKLKLS